MSTTVSRSSGDRLVDTVFAVVVAALGLGAGYGIVLGAAAVLNALGVQLSRAGVLVLTLVLVQGIGMGGVSIAYVLVRGFDFRSFLGLRRPTVRDAIVAGAGFALLAVSYVIVVIGISLLGVTPAENNVAAFTSGNPELLLLLIPASYLLIAPGEELLFRGVVQGTLRRAFGPAVAIAIASLVFGAIHIFAISGPTSGRLVYVGVVSVLAITLGTAYEYTDNLFVPIFIHGTYNAALFALAYLAARFAPQTQGLLV